MLCRKQHTEISLNAPKLMILLSKIKNALKKFENEKFQALRPENKCQMLVELVVSLGIHPTKVSKRLKVSGMI